MLSLNIKELFGTCCGYSIIKEDNKYYRVHKLEITQEVRDGAVNYLNNQREGHANSTALSQSAKDALIAGIDAQLAKIAD